MGAKFTEIDEGFKCENCGEEVKPLGYSCRNHCPKCLYSKHVDINPGDREETCHGLLKPIDVECGQIRKNKMAEDDDMDKVYEILKQKNNTNSF